MTNAGTGAGPQSLRLAQYLKELVGLRSKTIRDVEKYDQVLWLKDMPQERDCWSPAWADEFDLSDPFLEVKKQTFESPPTPPHVTNDWVNKEALREASQRIPPLLTAIFLPEETAKANHDEDPPLHQHFLKDHPEVEQAYEQYRSRWESWSKEHRRRQAIQRIYAKLFQLHTEIKKEGEVSEVVLGLGLLSWKAKVKGKEVPIRRHVFVGKVALTFEPGKGIIRVLPPGEGLQLQLEDDMLEAELRPDRSSYALANTQLDEMGNAVWDKSLLHQSLKSWAEALCADTVWSDGLEPKEGQGNNPTMAVAPALILRKRKQAGMIRTYNEIIDQLSRGETENVPLGWQSLTDDRALNEDGKSGSESIERSRFDRVPGAPREIYFPLPANREQKRIVESIERHSGVLVQGPPGTGKSHTIANLVCHLLATGKKILITAETDRALRVLKEKIPKEIQALCVSMLGQGGDAFAELNAAVEGITSKQNTFNPSEHQDYMKEIEADLDSSRRRLSEIDAEIRTLREDETCPHSIANGAYLGTASAIAEKVSNEKEAFGWLNLTRLAPDKSPLLAAHLLEWLKILQRYEPKQISYVNLKLPEPATLVSPEDFKTLVEAERKAKTALERVAQSQKHPAYDPIRKLSPENRESLRTQLHKISKKRFGLPAGNWAQETLGESIAGRTAKWQSILESSRTHLARIEKLFSSLGTKVVTIPDHLKPSKVKADTIVALNHLKNGGKWEVFFGLLTPKNLKGRTYLKEEVLVDGEPTKDEAGLHAIRIHLDLVLAFSELNKVWSGVVSPPTGDLRAREAVYKENVGDLEKVFQYAEDCRHATQQLASAQIPSPNWLNEDVAEWLGLIEVFATEAQCSIATQKVNACSEVLQTLRALHGTHPLVEKFIGAIEARDIPAFRECFRRLRIIEKARKDLQNRKKIEDFLKVTTVGLVDQVLVETQHEVWADRFSKWNAAWDWAVADAWLEKRTDLEYQQILFEQRHQLEKKIGELLAAAAANLAWFHFFKRLNPMETNALRSWREAVKAMGKGTGKSARLARLRIEARKYMNACRDSIPVWILPRYLVAEMIKTSFGRFDVVIVDEASQLGVESLFLFSYGQKIIVVGDDQQISPEGVGIADEAVVSLQNQFLEGMPHKHALTPQSSFYANAKIRFNQNIMLREHFRCMPEIIQFSNDLCYAINGTPLDPLRAYPANRLQPLVTRYIANGYRSGGSQHAQNIPEADAIVAQIAACVADQRYDHATMGVISLQGKAQAKLIEQKLLEALDPEIIEARQVICGDAYAFQGDERNVIFLSMVAAPGEKRIGVLSNESARQRFNVAMSRAQDQVWLFHSAQLGDLSEKCMRYNLLSYMLNPARKTTDENEQRFDSNFERLVYQRLTAKGFHVRTQVSIGNTNHRYRIDFVVEGMQGRLAVECDGDAWHGPDRYEQDMARQRDLERAGWQFARIRGSDFYRDPEMAMVPVWTELERLGIQPGGIDAEVAKPPEPLAMETRNPFPQTIEKPKSSSQTPGIQKL